MAKKIFLIKKKSWTCIPPVIKWSPMSRMGLDLTVKSSQAALITLQVLRTTPLHWIVPRLLPLGFSGSVFWWNLKQWRFQKHHLRSCNGTVALRLQPIEQTTQAGQWKPSQVIPCADKTKPVRQKGSWIIKENPVPWLNPPRLTVRGFRPGFVCLVTTVSPGRLCQGAACLPVSVQGSLDPGPQQALGPTQGSWFNAQHFRSWLLLCIQNPTHSIPICPYCHA